MAYPILTAAQSDKPIVARREVWPSRRETFLTTVAKLERFYAAGSIPNVEFAEAKEGINRALDRAMDVVREEHVNNGRWQDLPEAVRQFERMLSTGLHLVKSTLAKAEKFPATGHPFQADMIALLRETLPLAEMLATLNTPERRLKRAVKPVEERKPGYHPPPVSTEAEKVVLRLLETVTEADYQKLIGLLVAHYNERLQGYLTAQRAAIEASKRLDPYHHFMRGTGYPDVVGYDVVEKVVTNHGGVTPYETYSTDTVDAVFLREATKVADEYRTSFVVKNFRKVASVIEAKGNLKDGTVLYRSVDISGMVGIFRFTFADGAAFTVQNSVVQVVKQSRTRFLRFPLTFHNVLLAGGKKMPRPSEERMNSVFTAKAA